MNDVGPVMRLVPQPPASLPLHGLYLDHDLRQLAEGADHPLVVANFVASLDGRIAVPHSDGSGLSVPASIANDRDWRLFQELAVQADVIISSGRYLRDYAAGRAQEILRVYDDPRFADLREWRISRGLAAQPDLAIVSRSLDFPIPSASAHGDRQVVIVTSDSADSSRIRELEDQTARVIVAGDREVIGRGLTQALQSLGYRVIYSAAGPRVLAMLLADDLVDRLYLTLAARLLGGDPFASIVQGDQFYPPIDMRLHSLYHDAAGLDGAGQLFLCYQRVAKNQKAGEP